MAKVNVRMNVSYNYTVDVPEEILNIKTCEDEYALIDYCEEIDPVFDTIVHLMKCYNVDYWDASLLEIYNDETGEVYYEN